MKVRASSYGAAIGGGLGSAIATVVKWIVESGGGPVMPDTVELAMGVIITAVVGLAGAALTQPSS